MNAATEMAHKKGTMLMPADLSRKDGCVYCGGTQAVLSARIPTHGASCFTRYAHPSCVAASLQRDPSDEVARVFAIQFGMLRETEGAAGDHSPSL